MTIEDEKYIARRSAMQRRDDAHGTVEYDLVPAITQVTKTAHIVSCFIPIRSEIDPRDAMAALIKEGKTVCVPIIIGKAKPLEFRVWTEDTKLVVGEFGVSIPENSRTVVPDFVLAPLVAFDAKGTRLGYGGGFYDRTIAKLRASNHVPYVGVAYEAQKTSIPLPREATDVPIDGIITENGYQIF